MTNLPISYLAPIKLWISIVLLCLSMFCIPNSRAQDYFTVFQYHAKDYQAQNQNWALDKDSQGRLFIANNEGLLMMDGSQFRLFTLPGQAIMRSVKCIDDRVFTGSFQEFGYWSEQENGNWKYQSLSDTIDPSVFHNDEFWKIVKSDGKVYFQSFGSIFVSDQHGLHKLEIPGPILFLIKAEERLFVQKINGSLYELVDSHFIKLEGSELFQDKEVKTILKLENEWIIGTTSHGLFRFDGTSFYPWKTEADEILQSYKINNGIQLDSLLVFGTILKGAIVLDKNGKLLYHIHKGNGLQNNTVLAMCSDEEHNLWLGLDKGFDFIWFHSPFEIYSDPDIETGSVYTAALMDDMLYLGTNQGVYIFDYVLDKPLRYAGFYEGSQGQVWFLKVIDNQLYCGHNTGTFILKDKKMIRVSDINGGYNFKKILIENQEYYLQSSYNELALFTKEHGIWNKSHFLKGFNAPVRMLEIDHRGHLFLGHSISGLYIAQPDPRFESLDWIEQIDSKYNIDFQTNKVYEIDKRIVIADGKNWYQWDGLKMQFILWDAMDTQLGSFAGTQTIIPIGSDRYWLIHNREASLFEIRFDQARMLYRIIPSMFGLQLVNQYENIIALNDSLHLFCLENGIAILNLSKLQQLTDITKAPDIKEVVFSNENQNTKRHELVRPKKLTTTNRFNTLTIHFSSIGSSGIKNYFRYRLLDLDTSWSDWTTTNQLTFNRLSPGNYHFELKSLTAHGKDSEVISLPFRVLAPRYLQWYAFLSYFILSVVLIILSTNTYRRRRWRKQEKLLREENEQIKQQKKQAEAALIQFNNENLLSEIRSKNMELAKNTMAIIKKNELLIEIKKEIEKQKEQLGNRLPTKYYNRINRLIDRSIKSEHEWETFEHLFDQAHENFFKRLKQAYPDLTPSDFRLCAYLRMNLASKEIAPLLNISIRGVEEKRYRLRKKLQLQPNQNLSEFIISF